ncbi:hypothetical protein TrCOL_g5660 [Triparma columacea]|uniref:Myb-like domain-containing protein n=1 Tax=Triparma columacea TaxID=722753 RepID=A0A9W7GNJ1_9STRA|nr:hypothetical protein TrCOL_g5660 [Triparma columacea]
MEGDPRQNKEISQPTNYAPSVPGATSTNGSTEDGSIPLPILQSLSVRFQTSQIPEPNPLKRKTNVIPRKEEKKKVTTFSKEDIDFVTSYVTKNPAESWNMVTQALNKTLGREFKTKSVREAYINRVLNRKERMPWSQADDEALCSFVQSYGTAWGKIEKIVEGKGYEGGCRGRGRKQMQSRWKLLTVKGRFNEVWLAGGRGEELEKNLEELVGDCEVGEDAGTYMGGVLEFILADILNAAKEATENTTIGMGDIIKAVGGNREYRELIMKGGRGEGGGAAASTASREVRTGPANGAAGGAAKADAKRDPTDDSKGA